MEKLLKYAPPLLCGAAYAALTVSLSRLLVRNLAGLFRRVGTLVELDENALSYGAQILDQLNSAHILSPWLPFLLGGLAAAALAAWLFGLRRTKRIAIDLLLWILLLVPLALLALYFTSVNGIRVGSLIETLIPLLPHLL